MLPCGGIFFDFKKVYYFYKIKNVNIFSEEYP